MIAVEALASGSKGNCYLVSDGQTSLLLDAGVTLKRIKEWLWQGGHRLIDVSGCLISHSHLDHSKAGGGLLTAGIDLYASAETAQAMAWDGNHFHPMAGNQVEIGSWVVLPFPIIHDVPGAYGFLLYSLACDSKLLYLTDTMYSPVRFGQVDVMMVECNYTDAAMAAAINSGLVEESRAHRTRQTHMGLATLIELLKANQPDKLQKLYVLHLSDDNSDEWEIIAALREITRAKIIIC